MLLGGFGSQMLFILSGRETSMDKGLTIHPGEQVGMLSIG